MGVKFNNNMGQIYDFFIMPYNAFYTEKNQEDIIEDNLYDEFIESLKNKLLSYEEKIKKFYSKKSIVIDLLDSLNEIDDSEGIDEYLEHLSNLSEEEIRLKITYSILSSQNSESEYKEIREKAAVISRDSMKVINLIKDSEIDPAEKWKLFCFVQEPEKYLNEYVQLMKEIKPIFDDIYIDVEEEIRDYREEFDKKLQERGIDLLSEITDNYIKKSIFEDMEKLEVTVTLSYMDAYQMCFEMSEDKCNIYWGYKFEKYFEEIKKRNEHKLDRRVGTFKNFGDKTRYQIVKIISDDKVYSSKEIAKELGITGSTVCYHINNLMNSNILQLERKNNKTIYIVNKELLRNSVKEFFEDFKL